MAEQDFQKTVLAIRDQIGALDEVNTVGVWDYDEAVGIEEGPTKVSTVTLGTSFILDHPDNGILDTNILGDATKVTTVQRVVNSDNIFHDHFRDTTYQDSTNGSASWDTTNFRWEFTINEQGQTLSIFKNVQSVASVLPNLTIEGVSVLTTIDKISFPGGREVNIT